MKITIKTQLADWLTIINELFQIKATDYKDYEGMLIQDYFEVNRFELAKKVMKLREEHKSQIKLQFSRPLASALYHWLLRRANILPAEPANRYAYIAGLLHKQLIDSFTFTGCNELPENNNTLIINQ